ncbi:MAG: putative bifunctional diguanylate cyclase/phosphodiesterase [Gammaproteobacteria bacterium]
MNGYEQSVEALELAALVYRHSHEAMMVLDRDGTLIDVNPTFTTLTGFDRSEVIGRKLDVLRSGPEESEFHHALWAALREKGHWAGEVWNRRKNGHVYPEWLELNAVRDAQGEIVRYVAQAADVSTKKTNEHHIWRLANYDKLTGLPNRSMFAERLEHEVRRAHRTGRKLALLFLDLDGFKEVNDNLGHDVGDLLLQHVANRLAGCVRESDTIARLGGDEFIVILNEISDVAVVGSVAQKVVTTLASAFTLRGQPVHVSASAGITLYPDDGETFDVLLKNADQAMYAAKREGRNRYCYFTPAMQEQVNRRTRMISELRLALASNQFHVVYQPIVDLQTGRIVQAEALARWQHPLDGLVSPAVFIPLAAEAGLMPALGKLVFREAVQVARRLSLIEPQFVVSVNKSAAQFDGKQFSGRAHPWLDILAETGLGGASIAVEIAESMLLDMRPALLQQLQALRATGMKLAIDDFGTGFTSLQVLRKLDVDYLKLDRSLVCNLAPGSESEVLCDAAITMAHRLGIRTIAEGVETEAQRNVLLQLGCDYAQGFLFAEPMAGELVAEALKKQLAREDKPAAESHASSPMKRQFTR